MREVSIKILDRKGETLHVFENKFHMTDDNVQDIKNRLQKECAKMKHIPVD